MAITLCGKPASCGVSNKSREETIPVYKPMQMGAQTRRTWLCGLDGTIGWAEPPTRAGHAVIRHSSTPRGACREGQLRCCTASLTRERRACRGDCSQWPVWTGPAERGGKRGPGKGWRKAKHGGCWFAPDLQLWVNIVQGSGGSC